MSSGLSHAEALIVAEYLRRFGGPKTSKEWCPFDPHPKQKEFLDLPVREALYGGAGGGGKSVCLLMIALEHVDKPNYRALILRRTYTALSKAGALMDMSKLWLMGTDAKWKESEKRWEFPSGAIVQFGYLQDERDKENYQGAAYHTIIFDELTQFTESQYDYLLTRNRKVLGDPIPLKMRSASNPGGIGHKWVHARFVAHKNKLDCLYVPAKIDDNPSLDGAEYKATLGKIKDPILRAQLRDGEWIQDESRIIYPYDDERNGIDRVPTMKEPQYILGVDLGASEEKETTAFSLMMFSYHSPELVVGVECDKFADMIPSTIARKIRDYQERYDIMRVVMDIGALGIGYANEIQRRHGIPISAAKKLDKRGYINLMKGDLKSGDLKFVRHSNEKLIDEMTNLMWEDERQLEPCAVDGTKNPANHLCLDGSTMVLTSEGSVPIRDIKEGDMVVTRYGLCRVTKSWFTGDRTLWRVDTESGARLYGTSNHPVFVDGKGMVAIDSLLYGDSLVTCKATSLFSTESTTEGIQSQKSSSSESTTQENAPGFIGQFGNFIMDLSRKAIASITLMATLLTMRFRILSACHRQSMPASTCPRTSAEKSQSGAFLKLLKRPGLGTAPLKGGSGIGSMQKMSQKKDCGSILSVWSALKSLLRQPGQRKHARWPVSPSVAGTGKSTTRLAYARGAKENSVAISMASKDFAHDRVILITQTQIIAPVYDITVEHAHEFFANGILVSNSDATLYAWRECRHWQATAAEKIPPPGTTEHAEREARIMKDEALRRAMQDESTERRLQGRRR